MSESGDNQKPAKTINANLPDGTIRIELQRDKEIEHLHEENMDLNAKLAVIANKEWEEKSGQISKELGISQNEITFENYKAYKSIAEKKRAEASVSPPPAPHYEGASLAGQYYDAPIINSEDSPIDMMKFDSTEQAIAEMEKRAKNGDVTCKQYLGTLTKNFFKGNQTWEWRGKNFFNIIKDPVKINDTDPPEVKAAKKKRNAEIDKDKLAWVRID